MGRLGGGESGNEGDREIGMGGCPAQGVSYRVG